MKKTIIKNSLAAILVVGTMMLAQFSTNNVQAQTIDPPSCPTPCGDNGSGCLMTARVDAKGTVHCPSSSWDVNCCHYDD